MVSRVYFGVDEGRWKSRESQGKEIESITYRRSLVPLAYAVGHAHDRPGHLVAESPVLGAHAAMRGGSSLLLDGIVGVASDPKR